MRVISKYHDYMDIPYEKSEIYLRAMGREIEVSSIGGNRRIISIYETSEKALEMLDKMTEAYERGDKIFILE